MLTVCCWIGVQQNEKQIMCFIVMGSTIMSGVCLTIKLRAMMLKDLASALKPNQTLMLFVLANL